MKDGRYWRIIPWYDPVTREQHFTLVEEHFRNGAIIHDVRTQMDRGEFEQLYGVVSQAFHDNRTTSNEHNSSQLYNSLFR